MSNLFISHSSRDNAAAKELQARLEEQGHRSVFLDLDPEKGIQAGVSWERTLYTKLRACRAVIALCSDSYLASQWCFAEVALARMEGKELFVLQIDPWSEQTRMPSILTEEQYIDLRTNQDDGFQRLWNGFKVKGILAAEAREWKPEEPPYPGLRAFREADAPIFFGRDEEIRAGCELLSRVRRQGHPRLVMVLGSSGSGKSSLVRAGIVPQLRRDRGQWLVVKPFRPDRQPLRALAASLSQAFGEAGQATAWEEIHGWLEPAAAGQSAPVAELPASGEEAGPSPAAARERLLQALLAVEGDLSAADDTVAKSVRLLKDYLGQGQTATPPPSADAPLLPAASPLAELASRLRLQGGCAEAALALVIDQFEELLGHDASHPASRFLRMIRSAVEAEGSPLLVIGTMRSDYLGALQSCAPLQGLGFKSISVGPMSKDGMRQVIEEPAKLGQIQLEKGLSDLLLDDTQTSDALPLLAFTLRMMWDRHGGKRLFGIGEYKGFGRLQGAIAQVADETFQDALEQVADKASRQALARALRDAFLSMARPAAEGAGWSRQPVSWDQLSQEVRPALAPFIDPQRLLVKRQDGALEVAHEALFRSWGRLKGWLDENAEGLHLLREIQLEAKKWDEAATEEDKEPYLFRGGRLARALELREAGVLPLQDLDRAFVKASDSAEKARIEAEKARQRQKLRRARVFAAVVGALLLLAVGLGYKAHLESQVAFSRELAIAAQGSLDQDPELSVLLALQATEKALTAQAEAILRRAAGAARLKIPLMGHADEVLSVAFSPDSGRLATASADGTVKIWDAVSGDELRSLPGHAPAEVRSVAFSPVRPFLATGGSDGKVRIWDADTGAEVRTLNDSGEVLSVAFNHDGALVASGGTGKSAKIWDMASGELRLTLSGHSGWVRCVAFSSDGLRLATASTDRSATVWDAIRGGKGPTFSESGEVLSVAFSPDGYSLATASDDRIAKVWDIDSGEILQTLIGHADSITSLAFSPDGLQLATASQDRTVKVWDAVSGSFLFTVPHDSRVQSVAVSPNGARLAWAGEDGTAGVADLGGEELHTLSAGTPYEILGVAFSPDSRRVASASADGSAKLWNALSGAEIRTFKEHAGEVTSLAFSPAHGLLATASTDGKVKLWRPDSSSSVLTLDDSGELLSVAFSPDGRYLATGSDDESAKIWEISSSDGQGAALQGSLLHSLPGGSGRVVSVAFGRDGALIAAAGAGGAVKVWNAHAEGPALHSLAPDGDGAELTSVAFSPDGALIAASRYDGAAQVWDVDAEALLFTLPGDSGSLGLAFSPDGARLATAGKDRTVKVWALPARLGSSWRNPWTALQSGKASAPSLLYTHTSHRSSVRAVAFSPDGSLLASASDDATARIFAADVERLAAFARRRVGRNLSEDECRRYLHAERCPQLGLDVRAPQNGTQSMVSVRE